MLWTKDFSCSSNPLATSTIFTGDAISPVVQELKKKDFAAVGWRGGLINIEDQWRSVDDKGAGEVDVLFSYFLAVDKDAAVQSGGFNARAIYYRNADIEFSLRLKHAAGHLLQMDLPLEQGRHHGYYDTEESFRDTQSKKNYDRTLDGSNYFFFARNFNEILGRTTYAKRCVIR